MAKTIAEPAFTKFADASRIMKSPARDTVFDLEAGSRQSQPKS